MSSVITTSDINTSVPYTFCLPLLSGVIGVNASKMIPVGELYNPIRAEFYLAANDDAIYYGTAAAGAVWQIVNAELVVCYVEIQDDLYNTNPEETQYISTTTYKHASTTLTKNQGGEFTTLLPFRAASITGLYGRFRPYGNAVQGVNASAAYRKGASICPMMSSYYYRIGSAIYPNKPIYITNGNLVGTASESYAELLKSFHQLSSSIGNSSITHYQYNVQPSATQGMNQCYGPAKNSQNVGTSNNAFAIGLECQSMSNRNDLILSGISTLNSQIYFTGIIASGKYSSGTADGLTGFDYVFDNWAQMDMILVIQGGVMSAKY
jgi:hypothetical protein